MIKQLCSVHTRGSTTYFALLNTGFVEVFGDDDKYTRTSKEAFAFEECDSLVMKKGESHFTQYCLGRRNGRYIGLPKGVSPDTLRDIPDRSNYLWRHAFNGWHCGVNSDGELFSSYSSNPSQAMKQSSEMKLSRIKAWIRTDSHAIALAENGNLFLKSLTKGYVTGWTLERTDIRQIEGFCDGFLLLHKKGYLEVYMSHIMVYHGLIPDYLLEAT
jgi:hypothetical protein